MDKIPQSGPYTVENLREIIRLLRDRQNGCPWDKVQTHDSIRMNFLEEAYEAVDAINLNDPELLCEELGDVLMQVVFHTCIEEEQGHFTWSQVCDGVCQKLIARHPHIFGDADGIKDWDALKNEEKGRLTPADDFESVPLALPALMRAAKLQKRATRYGLTVRGEADAVRAALQDAETATEQPAAEAAVGEALFAAVALARRLGVDPEQALQQKNATFTEMAPKLISQEDGSSPSF